MSMGPRPAAPLRRAKAAAREAAAVSALLAALGAAGPAGAQDLFGTGTARPVTDLTGAPLSGAPLPGSSVTEGSGAALGRASAAAAQGGAAWATGAGRDGGGRLGSPVGEAVARTRSGSGALRAFAASFCRCWISLHSMDWTSHGRAAE